MLHRMRGVFASAASPAVGYLAAVLVPVAITMIVQRLDLPAFVFEHLVVLLVLAIAVPWGIGPSAIAALVSVVADNVLLRAPIGRPAITGYRDVIDLVLFAAVAVVVSSLVRRAHVARRAAEAAAARERRAREERDRLVATVMHDLATPLAVLSGTVQAARRRGVSSEAEQRQLLARLDIASARATSLVKALIAGQAPDADDFDLHATPVDLRAIVRPIVEMMERCSERHPVRFDTPAAPVVVRADRDRLQRVVENLVFNAIKYSPEGGAIEVSIDIEADQAVMRVRDYGIGIAPDALPRIFDAEYRAPEAAAHAPGLGLGLTIAAQVVGRHGGTIEARAANGRGAIVAVRLPLHQPAGAPWQHPRAPFGPPAAPGEAADRRDRPGEA